MCVVVNVVGLNMKFINRLERPKLRILLLLPGKKMLLKLKCQLFKLLIP